MPHIAGLSIVSLLVFILALVTSIDGHLIMLHQTAYPFDELGASFFK